MQTPLAEADHYPHIARCMDVWGLTPKFLDHYLHLDQECYNYYDVFAEIWRIHVKSPDDECGLGAVDLKRYGRWEISKKNQLLLHVQSEVQVMFQ